MDVDRPSDPVEAWVEALWTRHLDRLRFPEVRRGLQALSSLYVERRVRLARGKALDGAGKRAAFAMFYGPLHLVVARHVAIETGAARPGPDRILDLGCGTGAAGAGFALACGGWASLVGTDLNPWAVVEAEWSWTRLGLRGTAGRDRIERFDAAGAGTAVVLGWVVNEIEDSTRAGLLPRLLDAGRRGARILVIEPISRRVVPWWDEWAGAFVERGGRDDVWRIEPALPEKWHDLDRAAGLDHRELTARSLYLPADGPGTSAFPSSIVPAKIQWPT